MENITDKLHVNYGYVDGAMSVKTFNELLSLGTSYKFFGLTVTVLDVLNTGEGTSPKIPADFWLVGGTTRSNWRLKSIGTLVKNEQTDQLANLSSLCAAYIPEGFEVLTTDGEKYAWIANDWVLSQSTEGKQGPQGPQGPQGAEGTPGEKGAQGDKGDKGDQGPEGKQGPQGPQGADGTGVNILGSYDTYEELVEAHSAGTPGDAYLVQGDLYVWDDVNKSWNDVGDIKGPKGDKGDKGDQGEIGPQGVPGEKGAQGAQGEKGEKGDKGDKGDQGEKGETGEKGEKGDQGVQGEKGDKGDKGEKGETGEKGEKGDTGEAGPQGEKGDKGDKGDTGEKGEKGDQGVQGEKGDKGDKGDQGEAGPQGDKGDKGDTGAQGAQGEKGEKGDTGDQGPQGDKGEKGDTGDQGPQGVPGEKGDKGDQGEKGEKGDQGETGAQGAQGDKGDKGDTGDQGPQGYQGDKGDQGPEGKQGYQGPQGPQGNDGTGVNILGSYDTVEEFEAAGLSGKPGDAYLVAGDLYVWDEENQDWKNVGKIQGPQGPKGEDGVQGPEGYQGPQGPQGPRGADGKDGEDGVQGPIGYQGPQGPQGEKGEEGKQGPDGAVGYQGPQGAQGAEGYQGPQGAQGVQGDIGYQGPQGPEPDYSKVKEMAESAMTEVFVINPSAETPTSLEDVANALYWDEDGTEFRAPDETLPEINEGNTPEQDAIEETIVNAFEGGSNSYTAAEGAVINNVTIPSSVTTTSSTLTINGAFQDGATITNNSGKNLVINNTSGEAIDIFVNNSPATGSTSASANLKGEYNNIYINGNRLTATTVNEGVYIEPVDANNAMQVTAGWGDGSKLVTEASNEITVANTNSANLPSVEIDAPNATIIMTGGQYNELGVSTGNDTFKISGAFHAKKLVVKKGNVFVSGVDIYDFADDIIVNGNIIYASYEASGTNIAGFSKAGVTNVVGDIASNSRVGFGLFASGHYRYNLNGFNTSFNGGTSAALYFRGTPTVDIYGPGKLVDTSEDGYGVWAGSTGTTVNVYGGDFEAYTHVLYAYQGTINVYGGSFKLLDANPELDPNGHCKFLLNCYDANYQNRTAKINVYGGKFYNFNPAVSYSEPGSPVSFVAEGYHVVESTEGDVPVFTVVANE